MNSLIRVFFLCSCLGIIGLPVDTASAQQRVATPPVSAPGVLTVFQEVEPALRRDSGVPPMLPRFLPFTDAAHPIHAVVQSATTSGYSILLANALPCEGANWCLYGTVSGSTKPTSREGKAGRAVPVLLQGGIKASFFDSECDTHCSQAYVEWQEKSYYYSIGIKGPSPMRNTLVKVANSAVRPTIRH